jgi:hypothetical protein
MHSADDEDTAMSVSVYLDRLKGPKSHLEYFMDGQVDYLTERCWILSDPLYLYITIYDGHRCLETLSELRSVFIDRPPIGSALYINKAEQRTKVGTGPHVDGEGLVLGVHCAMSGPAGAANVVSLYPTPSNPHLLECRNKTLGLEPGVLAFDRDVLVEDPTLRQVRENECSRYNSNSKLGFADVEPRKGCIIGSHGHSSWPSACICQGRSGRQCCSTQFKE